MQQEYLIGHRVLADAPCIQRVLKNQFHIFEIMEAYRNTAVSIQKGFVNDTNNIHSFYRMSFTERQ